MANLNNDLENDLENDKNLSLIKSIRTHKDGDNDSICIEIVNIKKATDDDAKFLKIFFDTDENEINLQDFNSHNEFANFIPINFENVLVSYSEEANFFALFFNCMMIPFVSVDKKASNFLFEYFKKIGLKFKKTKTIVTEKEIKDGVVEKETIVTSDLNESDEMPAFLN